MRTIHLCVLTIALSLFSLSGFAETVKIPLGQQGKAWNVETPRTGQTMNQVEERYGAPLDKSGPVGTPAIYTWEYELFSVYFEGTHVIHSVVKTSPTDAS